MRRSMKIRVRVNKFYTFTASALIQVVGAPVYTFSIYAAAVGSTLGLDQVQLEGLGSMLAFGNFLALLSGTVYELMEKHNRMGPRITIWVGVVLGALGYGGLYMAASGSLQLNYAGLLAFAFIAGNASSWFDTATIVTNVRNFPNNRGAVVGLLKSFVGLSGSIYSSVYTSSLMPDAAAYLLMLSFTVSLIPLVLSLCVNHVPYVELAEVHSFNNWLNPETRFLLTYVTVAALALYQMTSAILEGMGELRPGAGSQDLDLLDLNTLGMFGLLSVVLLVPWRSGGIRSTYVHDHLADPEEKSSTIPQWIKQLQHTSTLSSATIRARLDSISAALSPSGPRQQAAAARAAGRRPAGGAAASPAWPSGSSAPGVGADVGALATTISEGEENADLSPGHARLRNIRPHFAGPDAVAPVIRAVQSAAAVVAPAGADDTSSPGAFYTQGSLNDNDAQVAGELQEPLLQQFTQQQQQQQLQHKQMQQHVCEEGDDDLEQLPPVQAAVPWRTSVSAAPSGSSLISTPVECHHQFTNLSLSQAVRTVQFWLLFVLFLAGVGSCLTYLNNLTQITIALGGAAGDQVVFVSIFAVGNAAGRLLMGMIPESALHSSGTPRTYWLLGTFAALTAAVLGAAAATQTSHLFLLSPALGLCYGAVFCLIPAIAADVFGLRHFAANYSGLQTACAIACYVFPTQLAGFFYSKAVAAHGFVEPCVGHDCYGPTFVVEAVMCLLGCVAAAVVMVTTRGVYELLSAHLHEVEEEEQQDMIEQWQAGHHLLPTVRVPSDPTISATTGVPAGQYGQSFHRSRGHNNTTIAQLQHNSMARQQQQHGAGTARTPSAGHLAIAGGLRHNSS